MPADLNFEVATAATEPQLRKLLRDNPVAGDIRVALEREPNAFQAARISGDEFQLMLAFADARQKLVASGARFEFTAYVNGICQRIGYFGELRTDGGLKQRRTLLLESYRTMRGYHEAGNVPFYFTTIIADNFAARRLFEAGLSDMPTYQPLETMVTFTIPTKSAARGRRPARQVDAATEEQLVEIVELLAHTGPDYQFQPVWSESTLRSEARCRNLSPQDFYLCHDGDRLKGCLALWDQRAFKQTVIQGYARRLDAIRPVFNVVAPLLRRPRLPSPGSMLESAFLSHMAVAPDDSDTLVALIRQACCHALERGLDYVMIAFAERNPLSAVIQKHFLCHSYVSMIYVVYWDDGASEASKLDGRLPHPEMAIL